MTDTNEVLKKVRALWERAGTEGEKAAAWAAIERIEARLKAEGQDALHLEVMGLRIEIQRKHPHYEFFKANRLFNDNESRRVPLDEILRRGSSTNYKGSSYTSQAANAYTQTYFVETVKPSDPKETALYEQARANAASKEEKEKREAEAKKKEAEKAANIEALNKFAVSFFNFGGR